MNIYKSKIKPHHLWTKSRRDGKSVAHIGAGKGGNTVSCLCCKESFQKGAYQKHLWRTDNPEEYLIWRYWMNLQSNCCKKFDRNGHHVQRKLTVDEVKQLLNEAGITIHDVGRKKGQYNLARFKDLGDYEMGNCRFVTKEQNLDELYANWDIVNVTEKRLDTYNSNVWARHRALFED